MLKQISYWLVIIGSVNVGLMGLGGLFGSNWNILGMILGYLGSIIMNIIYVLIGISAIMMVVDKK